MSIEVPMQARNSYSRQSPYEKEVLYTTSAGRSREVVSKRKSKRRTRRVTIATAIGLGAFVLPIAGGLRLYSRNRSAWPLLYTFILSLITFIFYGYDKVQSRSSGWRVSENTLHALELFGGWPGALVGRHFFQHKTTKMSFQITFWLIVLMHQLLWWAIFKSNI